MFNIILAIATLSGIIIAILPDNNGYIRLIIFLGTAVIVFFSKTCEVIHENKKLKKEAVGLKKETIELKKETIELKKQEVENIANEKYKEFNSKVLKEIKEIFNGSYCFYFMRNSSFEEIFKEDLYDSLNEYHYKLKNDPEFYFLDSELNSLKKDLDHSIEEILLILSFNAQFLDVNPILYAVPSDWRESQPEKFKEITTKANHHAERIVTIYEELIQSARMKTLDF